MGRGCGKERGEKDEKNERDFENHSRHHSVPVITGRVVLKKGEEQCCIAMIVRAFSMKKNL